MVGRASRHALTAILVFAAACDSTTPPPVIDGECREGCFVLADGLCSVGGVAVNAGQVYWATCDGVVTMRGTTTTRVSPSGKPQLAGLAVDSTNAYVTNPSGGNVFAMSLTSGTDVKVLASGASSPNHIVLHGGFLYWTDESDAGAVMRAPADGSAPATTIAASQAHPIGIAVDDAFVYWANSGSGDVLRAPVAGGAPTTIASGEHAPTGVAVDAEFVYWTSPVDGTVRKAPLAGGAAATLTTGQAQPKDVAVDARNVYWTRTGGVGRYALATGAVSDLATAQTAPAYLLADGTHVYWTDPGPNPATDGRVVAMAAP